jgi:hypothetical protein
VIVICQIFVGRACALVTRSRLPRRRGAGIVTRPDYLVESLLVIDLYFLFDFRVLQHQKAPTLGITAARGGLTGEAQAEAFRDTWEWSEGASRAYDDLMRANGDVALVISGLRKWLGDNAMMAYLAMMAVRLMELRRVRPFGSQI